MNCEEFQGMSKKFTTLSETSRAERAAMVEHFESCPACQDYVLDIVKTAIGNGLTLTKEKEKEIAEMCDKDWQDPEFVESSCGKEHQAEQGGTGKAESPRNRLGT